MFVVFLVDKVFLTLKNNVIVTRTNFQLLPEALRPHTFMIQKETVALEHSSQFSKSSLQESQRLNKTYHFFPEEINFISEDYLYVCCEGMSLCASVKKNTCFTEVKTI